MRSMFSGGDMRLTPADVDAPDEPLPCPKTAVMGVQHVIARFSDTRHADSDTRANPGRALGGIGTANFGTILRWVLLGRDVLRPKQAPGARNSLSSPGDSCSTPYQGQPHLLPP